MTINWNSALAWVSSFLADQGAPAPAGACTVTYTVHGQWPGGFNAQVNVTNTGKQRSTAGP